MEKQKCLKCGKEVVLSDTDVYVWDKTITVYFEYRCYSCGATHITREEFKRKKEILVCEETGT